MLDQLNKLLRYIFEPSPNGGSRGHYILEERHFGRTALFFLGALLVIWLGSGVYAIQEGEEAVIMRFGKFVSKGRPGLNYHFPSPIENKIVEKVNQSRRIEIGYRSNSRSVFRSNTDNGSRSISTESTMLTGDENIVDLNADVMWHIKDLEAYVFNVKMVEETLKIVSESAIREVIAKTPISSVLSNHKQEIADNIELLIQKVLDQYHAGIQIEKVQLLKAEPPSEVIDAYRDVQTSKADKEREINQADAYRNDIVPKARGEAAKIVEEALGYKESVVSKAEGEGKRFELILSQYQQNKQITRDRLTLDAVEEVLKGSKKIIVKHNLLPHMQVNGADR